MTQLKGEEETRKVNRIVEILREKKRVLLTILFIFIAIFAYTVYTKYQIANPSAPYEIVHVEKRDMVKTISVSGEVVSENEVELGSDVSGQITELYAEVGQLVKRGVILAKVEDSAQRAQVTQTLGALASAKAQNNLGILYINIRIWTASI